MKLAPLMACCALAYGADWDRYRGPNGSGVSAEKGLPESLDPAKTLAWKTAVPAGNSSPVVAGGRLYLTAHEKDKRFVLCFNAVSGAELWRAEVEKARDEVAHPINGPTTPTVVSDGKSVFAFFPEFGIAAFDSKGKALWRAPLGPFAAVQGMASSLAMAEGLVFAQVDTPDEAYVAAFEAKSGKQAWKTERPVGFLGSYTTPAFRKVNGGPLEVVVAGALELTGYQAKTGEKLWWGRGLTNGPAALPLVEGRDVFTMEPSGSAGPPFGDLLKKYDKNQDGAIQKSEYPNGNVNDRIWGRLFSSADRHAGNGDGAVTQKEWDGAFEALSVAGGLIRSTPGSGEMPKSAMAWRHTKSIPYVTAPVLYQGVLYVVRDGGILMAFDPASGKVLREERLKDGLGQYYASPVAGDGKIYFVNLEGKTTVIRAGAEWQHLASADLDDKVIATPAISGGRVFVRTAKTLYAFGGTADKKSKSQPK